MGEICQKCRLWKTSQSSSGVYSCNKLQGTGNINSDVMFVADWPGDDEIQHKIPFHGFFGQLLKNTAKSVGVNIDNCYFTYLCKCKPGYDKPPAKNEMNACLEYLQEEIVNIKPRIVVGLGGNISSTLGIKGTITNIHGQVFDYKFIFKDGLEYVVKFMPVYHPAYVNNFVEKSRQRKEFHQDLGKVLRFVNGEELIKKEVVNYIVAKTIGEVTEIVDKLLKSEWVSYDSETTHLSCFKGKILMVSFSDGPGKGYVIPYEYPGIFNEAEQDFVRRELGRILGSDVKKIMQNGKFDIQFLFKYNIPIKMFVFDTMIAHGLLDENSPHGLANTVPVYTDMGNYKDEVHDYIVGKIKISLGLDEKGKERFRDSTILDCPYEKLTFYAAQDADATFRLFLKFKVMLENENLYKLLVQVANPVSYVLAQMEFTGIKGDIEYVNLAVDKFRNELIELDKLVQNSSQVKKYLEKYNKAKRLSKKKFANRGLDYEVIINRLIGFGQADNLGNVKSNFFGLDSNFKRDFPNYTEEQLVELEDMLYESSGKFNISSPKQKIELLFDIMELDPVKYNRITEKQKEKGKKQGQESVDADALQELFNKTKIKVIGDILKYAKVKKFSEYVESYKELLKESLDGRIHTNYNQCVAVTGRLSSSKPNLQTIPKRDKEKAKVVRRAFIAKDGYTFVEADFSQIEFRIWGHCSQDEKLLELLENGFDIHYQIASRILGKPIDKVTEEERSNIKSVVYGMMYGMSNFSLSKELGLEEYEVNRLVNGFFTMFPRAANWMQENIAQMERLGYVANFLGRRRRALDIYSKKKEMKESAQRQSRNFPLQSGSADLIYKVMIRIYRTLLEYDSKLILQIHDSLVFEVKDEILPIILPIIKDVMENTVKLLCKIPVGMEMGKNLSEMSKLNFNDNGIEIADKVDEKGKKIFRILYDK